MKIVHENKNQLSIQKLSEIVKNFISCILALVLIWLIYIEVSKNYCVEQHRMLTNKEYLSIVLNSLLKSGNMQIHSWDNTVESYLAHHPDCCGDFNRSRSLFDGIPVVQVTYELSDEGKKLYGDSEKYTYYEDLSWLTACGKVVESTGDTTSPPKNKPYSEN